MYIFPPRGLRAPHPDFDGAGPAHPADAGLIRPSPGGGEKHVSFRNLMGLPAPHPGSLFVRTKSDQKTARREKPFRWGFSPVTPSSATTQRGARVGTSSASLIPPQASGFGRCAAPPSSSANAALVCLGAAPSGPFLPITDGLNLFDGGSAFQGCGGGGESQEGAAAPSFPIPMSPRSPGGSPR